MTVTSPCTGICKLDETTGWCLGCGRSGDEILDWRNQPEAVRQNVWDQIPDRLSRLGVSCLRLPWTTEDIRDFVVSSLTERRGTWVMGVLGAVAEYTFADGEETHVSQSGHELIAKTRNGAMRMTIDDDIRALTFDPRGIQEEPRVVLAVKRERGRLPVSSVIKDLEEDTNGILPAEDTRLFDLGLGRKEARFCVRVGSGRARDALSKARDLSFHQALPHISGPLLSESPDRVIETALGRIEVQGHILPPNGLSPNGPHTHLLPDQLAIGRALPVGMDLPRAYLPGAIFYPKT